MVGKIPAEDIKCGGRGISAGTGAGDLRQEAFRTFPEIRNQLWEGELWNHFYYVETVGSVSEENIRRYIEHQSKAY